MTKSPEGNRVRVLLAEIVGVHGIRGEVALRTYTGDPTDVASYGALANEAGDTLFKLENVKAVGKKIVARVSGIRDRNMAEGLRGTKLYVERAKLPQASEDEFYHVDLVGLAAVTREGEEIGRVVAVENFGAGDLLEIAPRAGGPTRYIAFTKANVPDVDIATGRIVVSMPDESGEKEPDNAAEDNRDDDADIVDTN